MTEYKTLDVKYMGDRRKWKAPIHGELWNWNKFWLMGCPACGKVATLRHAEGGHTITLDGDKATISPSVGCPYADCDAHYFVKNGKVHPA